MITDDVPDDPLDKWRPGPGESARAAQLWQLCLADHPTFYGVFVTTCDAVLLERNLPRVLAAILLHGRDLAEAACTDRELVQARLAAAVNEGREGALGEAVIHD